MRGTRSTPADHPALVAVTTLAPGFILRELEPVFEVGF
jgi:flagellar biosynthesis protein FliP